MNKTALTELIEHMDKVLSEPDSTKPFQEGYYHAVSFYRDKAISLLPKEKEDIGKAYEEGLLSTNPFASGAVYVKHNFTQYNPKPTP